MDEQKSQEPVKQLTDKELEAILKNQKEKRISRQSSLMNSHRPHGKNGLMPAMLF